MGLLKFWEIKSGHLVEVGVKSKLGANKFSQLSAFYFAEQNVKIFPLLQSRSLTVHWNFFINI